MISVERLYMVNLTTAWIGILAGFIFGAVLGVFFYKEDWLGGYDSWKRRMLRLGHISFFGIAIVNMFFFYTCQYLNLGQAHITSVLFVIASVTMPLVCILSAVNQRYRHLFFIPVFSLITGTTLLIINGIL